MLSSERILSLSALEGASSSKYKVWGDLSQWPCHFSTFHKCWWCQLQSGLGRCWCLCWGQLGTSSASRWSPSTETVPHLSPSIARSLCLSACRTHSSRPCSAIVLSQHWSRSNCVSNYSFDFTVVFTDFPGWMDSWLWRCWMMVLRWRTDIACPSTSPPRARITIPLNFKLALFF